MRIEIQEIDSSIPTLCLNMIVKNESKIILRLLESVVSIIDCYCISDTGSTDNTIELIETFFENHNIPGKIVPEPFQNFEYNRNFALKSCVGMSDYVLLMDADMILENTNNFDKRELSKADAFTILQGTPDFYYQNMRIVKNSGLFCYVGVTHEYISTPPDTRNGNLKKNELFINDVGDGGSKSDKFERDIRLLSEALEKDPKRLADRYLFYLANSYCDSGQFDKAIETYKKRIEIGGWVQETWTCYYRIGLCYKRMDKMADAVYYWLDAYNYYPDRVENLYEVIHHYRNIGRHRIANDIYKLAKSIIDKNLDRDGYLFLHNDMYTYKIEYEYSIIACYLGVFNVNDQIVAIFNNTNDNSIRNNTLCNMKFYKDIIKTTCVIDFGSIKNFTIGDKSIKFSSSSTCIVPKKNSDNYFLNMRYVNYWIDEHGAYHNCDQIITVNKFIELSRDFKVLDEKEFITENDGRRYLGIEDVRIFPNDKNPDEFDFIGTGYHPDCTIGVSVGKYDILNDILMPIDIKPNFTKSDCEKNWVFVPYKNENHIIYKWGPLQICKINYDTKELELVETRDNMPKMFHHVRGSTCAAVFEDELWFVLHIVSYESPRYYYHIIAVFDNSMNLKRFSAPFKFQNECIEYCLGLVVEKDRVIIPYSSWDRTTKLAVYDKGYIDSIVKYTK